MTQVDVVYRYEAAPSEDGAVAIARLREVYGIRQLTVREAEKTVRIEYDSTRLTEPVVHQMLRRAGLDVVERMIQWKTPPPPAEPAPAAASSAPAKA